MTPLERGVMPVSAPTPMPTPTPPPYPIFHENVIPIPNIPHCPLIRLTP